jgi:hypothetical protein
MNKWCKKCGNKFKSTGKFEKICNSCRKRPMILGGLK